MVKKIICLTASVLIILLMAFPCFALGTVDSVDAPYDIKYAVHHDGSNERITISFLLSDELAAVTAAPGAGISYVSGYIQADYRIDGGEWQYTAAWDTNPDASAYGADILPGATVMSFDFMYLNNSTAVEAAGAMVVKDENGANVFDLENHTLEVRLRAGVAYISTGNFITNSEWTQPVKIERKESPELPTQFEAPRISELKVEYTEDEMPYLSFRVKTPESMKQAQSMYLAYFPSSFQLKCFVDSGNGFTAVSMNSSGSFFSDEIKTVYLSEDTFDDEKNIKVKLQYLVYDKNDNPLYSESSEELRVTVPRWEKGKGILHAKCVTCGICKPIFGQCMFVVFGIAAVILVVAAIIVKIRVDKSRAVKARELEEKRRRAQEQRQAYDALKQAKKEKNKKSNK